MDLFSKKLTILYKNHKKQKNSSNIDNGKLKFKILKLISLMMMKNKRMPLFLVDIKKINKHIMGSGTNLNKMIHILVR